MQTNTAPITAMSSNTAASNLIKVLENIEPDEGAIPLLRTWFSTLRRNTEENLLNLATFLSHPFFSYHLQAPHYPNRTWSATIVSIYHRAQNDDRLRCNLYTIASPPGLQISTTPPSSYGGHQVPPLPSALSATTYICFFLPSLDKMQWIALTSSSSSHSKNNLKITPAPAVLPPELPFQLSPSLTYKTTTLNPLLADNALTAADALTLTSPLEIQHLSAGTTALYSTPSSLTIAASLYSEPNNRYPFELAIGLFSYLPLPHQVHINAGEKPPSNAYNKYSHLPLECPQDAPAAFARALDTMLSQFVEQYNERLLAHVSC